MEFRNYQGVEFEVPQARLRGVYEAVTRMRLLADGIRNCIEHCPPDRRDLVANLQYAWMQVSLEKKRLEAPSPQGVFECIQ